MLDFFLKKNIEAGIKAYKRKHTFINFNKIDTILILFNIEDWENIQPMLDDLEQCGKKIIAWTVKNKHTPTPQLPTFVKTISPKSDTNWMKLLDNKIINEFDNLEYDTLFDLTSTPNDYLLLLLTRNKSKFCVSFHHQTGLYDFVLLKRENQSFADAYLDLKKYLEHIQ